MDFAAPKKYKNRREVSEFLKKAVRRQDLRHVYASKILYSFTAFAAAFVVLIAISGIAKDYACNNMHTFSLAGRLTPKVNEERRMREFDKEIIPQRSGFEESVRSPTNSDSRFL